MLLIYDFDAGSESMELGAAKLNRLRCSIDQETLDMLFLIGLKIN
jgi:hypothetical protein